MARKTAMQIRVYIYFNYLIIIILLIIINIIKNKCRYFCKLSADSKRAGIELL